MTRKLTHYFYGAWLLLSGALGLLAAFALTLEKFHAYENPDAKASCDFSLLVQCTVNLNSSYGSAFGFPNPLLGLMTWPFVLATGVLVLFSVKLPKFWWYGFFTGMTFAAGFVTWLQYQSIMRLGTLCPWCMVTWFAVIPAFVATLLHLGRLGLLGKRFQSFFEEASHYTFLLTFLWLFGIALWAQLRLDWLGFLF